MYVRHADVDEPLRRQAGVFTARVADAGHRLAEFHFSAPARSGRLHADPHPGNFLVLADGRLGVLDFGATKRLSETFANVYRGFLSALAKGTTRPEVGPMLERAGFRITAILGDYHGKPWDPRADVWLILAEKSA